MKAQATQRRSGIALIVVMIAITVLTMLTVAFAFMMKVETKLAQNSNSEVQLMWLGRSGVDYARYILAQQMTIPNEPYDSLNQVWAGGPGSANNSNNVLSSLSLKDYPLGDGKFSIKIVDLERKVNINTANEMVLRQAFSLMGGEAGDADVAISSILDWVQPGNTPRPNGAKSDYYQGLTPPYFCKNAPIDDLSELLLVKGVTPEMYWGGSATNHPPAAFQGVRGRGSLSDEAPNYAYGLADLFTPMSTGRININTASSEVLQMIPGVDENIASEIIRQRAGPDGVDGTDDDTPFISVGEVQVGGPVMSSLQQYCDVHSHTFQVTVDADVAGYTRQFVAILGRTSQTDIKILSFYWKDINSNGAE